MSEISHQQIGDSGLSLLAERMKERFLTGFFGNDFSSIFQNSLGFVSNIFQVWEWIESRPEQIKKKEQVDINELAEELNSQLAALNFRMESFKESFKEYFKQLNCRFDTIHTTRKSIDPDCLKYILPIVRQAPSKSNSNTATLTTKPTIHPKINHNFIYKNVHRT